MSDVESHDERQELLTDSSDDRSEYWNVTTRDARKCKSQKSRFCPGLLRACSAFLACTSVLATAILIWLFIDVRQQLTALRTELDQVIVGNERFSDDIQKIQELHTSSKHLQENQSVIFTNLTDFQLHMHSFQEQLKKIEDNYQNFQVQLNSLSVLVNKVSSNVTNFTSKINDMKKLQDTYETIQKNMSTIEQMILNLSKTTPMPQILTTSETKKNESNTVV